jgi:hypothetical protein
MHGEPRPQGVWHAWKENACGRIALFIAEEASMPSLVLDIALSAEKLLAVYQGRADRVLLFSRDGRRVSLPARHLRPFLGHDGVQGSFRLEFTDSGELLELRRLA